MAENAAASKLPYQHRQPGKLTRIALGVGIAVSVGVMPFVPASNAGFAIAGFVATILVAALVLFESLSVRVDRKGVVAAFGPGWPSCQVPLEEITEARVVRNRWYYGWGVRWIPGGWVFNVSGFDAVELELTSGRRFRIGTDDPQGLLAAIQAARELSAS